MGNDPVFEHPPWVSVYVDDATQKAPGYVRIREGNGRPGAAVVALWRGNIALVNVYRRPLSRWMWELPRGFADGGESPIQAARRELHEEIGLALEQCAFEDLGAVAPNSGILESEVQLFFARVPDAAGPLVPLDKDEIRRAEWISTSRVLEMVRDGRIIDGFTIAALARALLKGLIDVGTH